jgi:O-antigen ligase/tetratricopeptide (TPR) repeat protein
MTEPAPSAPDLRVPARGLLVGFLALSPVVFWYGLVEPFEACKSALTQLTGIALVVLAMAAARGRSWAWAWAEARGLFSGPIGAAVLCGVVSAVVSTAFSLSPRTSLQGAPDSNMGLGSVLGLAALFAASRALCPDEAAAGQLLRAAAVGLALSCAYALVQALGQDPVRWAQTWEYRGWVRPFGTQGNPNYLAGHAVMVLPIVLWQARRAAEARRGGAVLAGAALALLAAFAVVVSLSRGALVAGVLAVLVLLGSWRTRVPRRRALALLLALASACLLVFFGPDNRLRTALLGRLHEPLHSPGRWPIWKGAVRLFASHPWAGSGLDTFGLAWPGVRTPEYWEVEWGFMPGKAHNDFLQALATQGVLGAAAYAMLPLALLAGAARAWRRGRRRGWVLLLASVALAFYVQNLVGFAVASTAGLLAVVAGMLAGLGGREEGSGTTALPGPGPGFLPAITWLGVLLVLVTLWQGGGWQEPWRLALLALALSWAAVAGLAANPGHSGSSLPRLLGMPPLRAWRPLVLPSLGGAALAWPLLSPLLGSASSFRAEGWMHRDPSTAFAYHERAVRLAPGSALLHERRARAYWRAASQQPAAPGRRELLLAGRESAETACRLEPLSAGAQADRARILFDMAREGLVEAGEILAAFDQALALDRCDCFVLADAARAAVTLGHLGECERYLEAGLSQHPGLGMLLAERGALELARGQLAEAERSLRQALRAGWFREQERFDRATLLLGMVLLRTGRAAEAMSRVEAVLERHRDWVPARLLRALCRERLGRRGEALGEFRRILQRHPDHEEARAGVARLARGEEAEGP